MRIKSIEISGYKTLVDFKVNELQRDINILIGENNVGKSNILKALNAFFTKEKLEDNELPLSLHSFIGKVEKNHYIEIEFIDIPKHLSNRTSNILVNNLIRIRAIFSPGSNKKYKAKTKNGEYVDIHDDLKKSLPKYIYIGDLMEKKLDINALLELFPDISIGNKMEIETHSNQFIKRLWASGVSISLSPRTESNEGEEKYDVVIVDEYGNSNLFKDKSSGVQQMSYLSLFYALNLLSGETNIILGIEEPESNLHTSLQKQVFRHIKEHSSKVQSFITTHSPIFVDRANHNSVFHVKRNNEFHTIVRTKGYKDNWLKLREDLGLSISDTLLLGEVNLIVEGPTEKILFPKIIELLNKSGEINFYPEDLNILSAQGAQNTCYFSKLVSQTGVPTLVLLDNDTEGVNARRKIEQDDSLNVKIIVLNRENFEEVEIEDLIDDKIIIQSLNTVYKEGITAERFQEKRKNQHNGADKTKFQKFSKTFKALELREEPTLDKLSVAHKIRELTNDETNLDLIKVIFIEINSFIKNI